MPESKYERDMIIVRKHWNNFISRIKQDLSNLYVEHRQLVSMIKRIERVSIILQHSHDNMDFLLFHKESIIALDKSLSQKIAILDAFKKRNNLSNAVAVRTFNEILNSESIKRTIDELDSLRKKRDMLDEEIDKVEDLIHGAVFDRNVIVKYSKKYSLSEEELTALNLYAMFKSSKKQIQGNPKKTEPLIQEVSTNNVSNDEEEPVYDVTDQQTAEETLNYKEEFEGHKKRYEEIKNKSNLLLSKYYVILQDMTPTESQYYKIYCSMTDEELKEQSFKGEYDEAKSKIVAIKLFDAKSEIEKMLQSIPNSNYINKDDVEFFGEYITEFISLADKLKEIDKKITSKKKETAEIEDSKVFFLTDRKTQPFIPDIIKKSGYQGSLVNIIEKAQEGHIQKKKGSNIMPLKVSKKFKDEVGRAVFAVRNNKIIVSYIKLNSGTGLNDGGIMILTASLLNPNTIQEDTDKVIRENREQIIRQLGAIEKGDPQQIGLQETIREELTRSQIKEQTLEEGGLNGRKTK